MTSDQKTDQLIYINELAKVINRELNTIRKWEREGRLPKRLMPKRGHRGWRYWTHAQVYGKNGIIAWMKRNDVRPGNLWTDPSKEAEHVKNLRRPKYLNGRNIRSAREMAANGRSAEVILNRLEPRTRYSTRLNLYEALCKVAKLEGWEMPPWLTVYDIKMVRAMIARGKPLSYIIKKLEERYAFYRRPSELLSDLQRVADLQGWTLPPK